MCSYNFITNSTEMSSNSLKSTRKHQTGLSYKVQNLIHVTLFQDFTSQIMIQHSNHLQLFLWPSVFNNANYFMFVIWLNEALVTKMVFINPYSSLQEWANKRVIMSFKRSIFIEFKLDRNII